jgi:hypothetical protein
MNKRSPLSFRVRFAWAVFAVMARAVWGKRARRL